MYAIALGKWDHAAGRWFVRERVYLNGWRWTPLVKIKRRRKKPNLKHLIQEMRKFRDIQGDNGNWNYDGYMHGMYNGMEFMLAIAEDREPEYKSAPGEWLCDRSSEGVVSEPIAMN